MRKILLVLILLFFCCSYSSGQSWKWAKATTESRFGSVDPSEVATDLDGNVFETGEFRDTVGFSGHIISTKDPYGDAFLVKYDKTGNVLWAAGGRSDSNFYGFSYSVATDVSGNAYITGQFGDTVSFGGERLYAKNNDMFLVKYNAGGSVAWAVQSLLSSKAYAYGLAVSVDPKNNIYVAGYFADTMIIGHDSLLHGGVNGGIFIAKYDSSGNPIWAKEGIVRLGTNNFGDMSLTCDKYGNAYIYGPFCDTVKFGTTILTTPPYYSISKALYLIRFDSVGNINKVVEGQLLTSNSFTDNYVGYGSIHPIASDNWGNIYISCIYYGSIQLGSKILPGSSNNVNLFLAKLDSAGNVNWVQNGSIPSAASWVRGYSIAPDKYGYVYLAGTFQDTVTIGGITLISDSALPSFIVKFDSSGKGICGTFINNNNDDNNAIASDPLSGDIYFGGDTWEYGYCAFGNDTLTGSLHNEWGFMGKWQPCTENPDGREETNISASVDVYPNPSSGVYNLQIMNDGMETMNVEVYNILGEKVYAETLRPIQGNCSIDISANPAGIYLYRIIDNGEVLIASGKLAIQK